MESKKQLVFLNKLYETFDYDFQVTLQTKKIKRKWIKYSLASPKEREEANMRSILDIEIILDIEEREKYEDIKESLLKLGYQFKTYDTGSRGVHIHLIFPELRGYSKAKRETLRAFFINIYDADLSKKSENSMIALEDHIHFKSGIPKTLIDSVGDWTQNKLKNILWGFEQERKEKQIEKYKNKSKIIGQLQIDNYQKNVEEYWKEQAFFYDKAKIFWMWDKEKFKYEIVDETDLMVKIDTALGFLGQTVSNKIKQNYLEAFRRVGRMKQPKNAPSRWIQFKNKAFSLRSKNIYDVTPDYFFTNPIPYSIGDTTETPTMDKLFKEWVGDEYISDLYNIIAYCCYRNYPIQLLFCFCGSGRNGKSQFMNVLDNFIGKENITATELDVLLNSRFESFKLYKKLACMIGETNFGILTQSSLIKKLVGGDRIGFEKKNKDPFDDYNYAKIIISSNSLPSSTDTSDGFYRRWFIIDFPNEFEETGVEIWKTIPKSEYNNLARKIIEILPILLKNGKFNNQGTINNRKRKYIEMSNPLSIFIKKHCEINEDQIILYNRLYTHYIKYLAKHKKRRVKMKEFKNALEDEGFFVEKDNIKQNDGSYKSGYYIKGINFLDNLDNLDNTSTQILYSIETKWNHCPNSPKYPKEEFILTNEEKKELINHKCSVCGLSPCIGWTKKGNPICKECYGHKLTKYLKEE